MADKPQDKTLLPTLMAQNPAPVEKDSQDRKALVRQQVDRVMEVFLQLVPSNYVTQVQGPFYTMQFQAAAEQIADFQVTAQEVMADGVHEYTRTEFLYQILGALVFPDAPTMGYPEIPGDISYRNFLIRMVTLLLQGSTPKTVEQGIELLTEADIELIEKAVAARKLKGGRSAWGFDDQFSFEVNVSEQADNGFERFPLDPFRLQSNVQIVLRALKPAHTLYDYRHLFRETFGSLFGDTWSFDYKTYFYEDYRRYWLGSRQVSGTLGQTLIDRSLFTDPTRDFRLVLPGASLVVLSGPNSIHAGGTEGTSASTDEGHVGRYRVKDILAFPVGTDATARKYTTSGGLSGSATVVGDVIHDLNQDFGSALEGATLTFTEGPNAGTYLLKTLLGSEGGPVGKASGPATRVRVASSILRIERRMAVATTGQSYQVAVDRLGVQEPRTVQGEDASLFFVR